MTSPRSNQPLADDDDPFLSLRSGATEILLIRHADALPDSQHVIAGGYDEQPLSALGNRQAQALARRLENEKLAALYASPAPRARATAAYVSQAVGLPVQIEPGVREVYFGETGIQSGEDNATASLSDVLRAQLRLAAVTAMTTGSWASIDGAEPSAVLRARVNDTVSSLANAHSGQRIAIISHAGTINAYLAAVLGLERDYFFPAANTSISIVRVRGSRHLLLCLNDVGHLRSEGLLALPPE